MLTISFPISFWNRKTENIVMNTKIYQEKIPVRVDWLDFKKTLKLSTLFRLFQDVALRHLESISFGDEIIRGEGLHWVVSRYHLEINHMPKYGDTLIIKTYPEPLLAYFFPRQFFVANDEGEILIKAGSLWALVDEKKRTMVMPNSSLLKDYGITTGEEIHYPLPYKTKEGKNKSVIKASYSSCDLNSHLNNCSYIDILEDMIPIDYLASHSPKTVDIHYKKEILLGQEIPLSYEENDNLYTFHSDNFSLGIQFQKD